MSASSARNWARAKPILRALLLNRIYYKFKIQTAIRGLSESTKPLWRSKYTDTQPSDYSLVHGEFSRLKRKEIFFNNNEETSAASVPIHRGECSLLEECLLIHLVEFTQVSWTFPSSLHSSKCCLKNKVGLQIWII